MKNIWHFVKYVLSSNLKKRRYYEKKNILVLFSVILAFVFALSFVITNNANDCINSPTRVIDVNKIGSLSCEEKMEKVLSNYNDYKGDVRDNTLFFEGELIIPYDSLTGVEFLSSATHELTKKHSTYYDVQSESFGLKTLYIQNGQVIKEENEQLSVLYDEVVEDFYFILDDGEKVYVKQTFKEENYDECLFLTSVLIGGAIAALFATTVVVSIPAVISGQRKVFDKISNWLSRFYRPVAKPMPVTNTATPTVTISQTKYKTKEITQTDAKRLSISLYYLCFADPTNGKMYISLNNIDFNTAVVVMSVPVVVPCIGNANKDMVASVFQLVKAWHLMWLQRLAFIVQLQKNMGSIIAGISILYIR